MRYEEQRRPALAIQLDEEVPRVQAEVDLLKVNHLSADQVLSEANDLYGRWPSLSRDEKQNRFGEQPSQWRWSSASVR